MPVDAFLGIDIGTSSVKAVVVSANGEVLSSASSPLSVTVPAPGWAEQDPEDWWQATVSAVSEAVSQIESPSQVRAVGLSGQMHSLVALDASWRVIRPAILWNDVRTTEQCEQIRNTVGDDGLRDMCGNPALEGFTATRLLWLRQHEPQNFAQIKQVLMPKDYIRFRMTGELATEPSDASGTLLFDVRRRGWSARMCRLIEIDPWLLPPVIGSTEHAGNITSEAAKLLSIPEGTVVVGGGADNACAATGSGVVSSGDLLVTVGTSGAVVAPTSEPAVDPGMRIHSMAHVAPGTWYLMGVVLSAGAALAWWRSALADGGEGSSFDELVASASGVPAGSSGLTFLPYLTGERTPHADSNARGVFAGMNSSHTKTHMTRAVLEGVTFALRDSLELMRQLGVSAHTAVATGGGSRSLLWRQMLGDVLQVPMRTVSPTGGAPLGAAMLAAAGAGTARSIAEISQQWLKTDEQVDPDPVTAQAYQDAYGRYRTLYPALSDWFAAGAP